MSMVMTPKVNSNNHNGNATKRAHQVLFTKSRVHKTRPLLNIST